MEKVIEARSLCFRYGSEMVLKDVDFAVEKGDFTAIIGANGAGKSTLLRLLLGEIEAEKGSVSLFGEPVSRFKSWPRIGYVPQTNILAGNGFPATVEEIVRENMFSQIGLFRFPKKEHRAKVRKTLETVGMAPYAKHLVGNLSGGQQQRVLLARALVSDTEILLLDEPASGVDAENTRIFYDLLLKLNQEREMTIAMVTHDVAGVADIASKVLCLEEGSIVELEKAQILEELAHKHKHPHL